MTLALTMVMIFQQFFVYADDDYDDDDDADDAILAQVEVLPSRGALPAAVLRQPRRLGGLCLCLRRRRRCLPLSVGACAPGPPRGACGRGRGAIFLGGRVVDEKVQSSKGVLSSEGRLRSEGVLLSSEGVQIAEGPAPAENEPLRVLASWSRRTRCSRRSRRT